MSSAHLIPPEHRVHGEDIALPLIETISAIRSHNAARITWHKHAHFELLLLLEGATAYEFRASRPVDLSGGHFLVVPPGTMHRGVDDLRMPASLCGIVFDPRLAGALRNSPFTRRDLKWMLGQFERHGLAARRMSADLRRVALSLSRQLCAEEPMDEVRALTFRLLACSALVEAARQLAGTRHSPIEHVVATAVAHMETHFNEPLPMNELARTAGCGRARWFHLFKQSTGMSPNDYLQRLRVNKARKLLADPKRTVTDIAFAVGFSSSQYFCNVFRKYTGSTPTNFRARAAKKTR